MTDLPIATRLDARVSGPECNGTADRDLLRQAAALIRDLTAALDRAETLLQAAFDLIDRSDAAQSVVVFYDGTDCDGLCLMQDCETAIEDARAALAKARKA